MKKLPFYLSVVLIFRTYILSHASTELQNLSAWMSRFTDWTFLFPPCLNHYEKQLVCIFNLSSCPHQYLMGRLFYWAMCTSFFLYLTLAVFRVTANMIKTILGRNICLLPFISLQQRKTQHFSKFPFCTLFHEICGSQLKKFWCLIFQKKTFSMILIIKILFFSLIFLSDHFYHFNQILFRLSPLESWSWKHWQSSGCKVCCVILTALIL